MHKYIVNASIQVLPVVRDRHPYEWVDIAIEAIAGSGIKYDIGPFATVIEGPYEQVMEVIRQVNETLYRKGCAEWITGIQLQIRSEGDITGEEKVAKFSQ